jgi:hypothetical protein
MRTMQRYLILGLATAAAPIALVTAAPPSGADCNYNGGATVCAQGEVRGADGVPRASTPYVPYPCENDWYCGDDWDLDVAWDPGRPGIGGPGGPGGPGVGGGPIIRPGGGRGR